MKKTLIIHPKDRTTDFLEFTYDRIKYKTIIRGGVSLSELNEEIKRNDRIFMMGHGCPTGLFSVGQFQQAYGLIISVQNVELLRNKECVFIWCNADAFVKTHNLKGFYSGMFISEVGEAQYCGFPKTEINEVVTSNITFSKILGAHSDKPIEKMFGNTKKDYLKLAEKNEIAKYNYDRLYCNVENYVL